MDDSSLSPDALFSPSKAAQQRAQAHDWQHVEAWLSSLYPNRALPAFERNDETLRTLLALAAANERANEEAGLVEALEEEVRNEMSQAGVKAGEAEADAELIDTLERHLTEEGQQSLDALANLSTALNAPDTDPETLAHALLALSTHQSQLSLHEAALSTLRQLLSRDLQTLRDTLQNITSEPSLTAPPSLSRQTADYIRQTKQFLPKLKEYEERLNALPLPDPPSPTAQSSPTRTRTRNRAYSSLAKPASPFETAGGAAKQLASAGVPVSSTSLEKLVQAEDEVARLRSAVAGLEAQVKAYKDLPPEKEEARELVQERQRVLAELKAKRDGAFEALVE